MWVRLSGAARNYQNTETGEILSRRQYDKRFGALAKAGLKSYEEKAVKNREVNELEQLARPARGRSSIKKIAPELREDIAKQRADFKHQKEQTAAVQKAIARAKNRARRRPKITDRLLRPGAMGKRVTVPLEQEAIEEVIEEARHTHVAMYGVGVNGIHETTGKFLSIWYHPDRLEIMRDISIDFTEEDFEGMLEMVAERAYFIPVSAFVHLAFDIDYAKKRKETHIRKKRKQVFGNSV